ncbi:MAG: PspC domain-containing protein [bacterium]
MKRLYRSVTDKKIAGICGGIGEYLDVDPTVIRLLTVILWLVTWFFPVFIGYVIAWFIIPEGSRYPQTQQSTPQP